MAAGFTIPSTLGNRITQADPLGFRSTAQHYTAKIVPGFSSRVRNRGWYAILCWGAWQLEESSYQQHRVVDPANSREDRRNRLRFLPRALRLARAITDPEGDDRAWRYGNSLRWWQDHRDADTDYRDPKRPPFFGSRSGEVANGALGCMRRSLERMHLFVPSEDRLYQQHDPVVDRDRSCMVTERGTILAKAFHRDLERRGLVTLVQDWALWPDYASGYAEVSTRSRMLNRLAAAVPFRASGLFDRSGFPDTWAALESVWHLDADPLIAADHGCGPWGAADRWLRLRTDDVEIPTPVGDDPWTTRLGLAVEALRCLSGPGPEPLFEALGTCFVDGMRGVLPNGSLEAALGMDHHRPIVGSAAEVYARTRERWLRADDALDRWEQDHRELMGWCPLSESQAGGGHRTFRAWVDAHAAPSVSNLIDLHRGLPRFQSGATRPLWDRDGDRIYLDSTFPWSAVETTQAGHATVIPDDGDAEADADPFLDDRTLQTWFWYAVDRAGAVLTEGQR